MFEKKTNTDASPALSCILSCCHNINIKHWPFLTVQGFTDMHNMYSGFTISCFLLRLMQRYFSIKCRTDVCPLIVYTWIYKSSGERVHTVKHVSVLPFLWLKFLTANDRFMDLRPSKGSNGVQYSIIHIHTRFHKVRRPWSPLRLTLTFHLVFQVFLIFAGFRTK